MGLKRTIAYFDALLSAPAEPVASDRKRKKTEWKSRRLSAAPAADERVDILGVRVSAINLDDAVAAIEVWIGRGDRRYVCVTGAHGLMESRRDDRLRRIHNEAGLVTPDGMPLVWLARLMGKKRTRRVYGPDLMRRVTAISAARGYRQFYYGGAEGVAETLQGVLTAAHPRLAGCRRALPAVPRARRRGGSSHRRGHQRRPPRHRLGRPQHPETGVVDGEPSRPH